jgi:hypothetical protein
MQIKARIIIIFIIFLLHFQIIHPSLIKALITLMSHVDILTLNI